MKASIRKVYKSLLEKFANHAVRKLCIQTYKQFFIRSVMRKYSKIYVEKEYQDRDFFK